MDDRHVIRVKRRRDEDPQEALVLSKRRKESGTGEEVATVLKFVGTVNRQTDSVPHVARLSNNDARSLAAKQPSKMPADLQADCKHDSLEEHRQHAQQGMFHIVNCSRVVEETAITTIVDIEKQTLPTELNSHSTTMPTASTNTTTSESHGTTAAAPLPDPQAAGKPSREVDFVYDVYVSEEGEPGFIISSDEEVWDFLMTVFYK